MDQPNQLFREYPVLGAVYALREVGDDLRYLMNSLTGEYYEVETPQMAALRLANGTLSVVEIAHRVDVPAEDVASFFAEQRDTDVVELSPIPVPARPPHYRRSEPPHLSDALVEVTGRCNLMCAHCFNSAFNADEAIAREMTTHQVLRLISELDDLNLRRLQLSGGEPLLRQDLWEIIDAIASHRIFLDVISTNATAVTEELAERLGRRFREHGALYISMDGVTAAAYESLRGKNVFPRFESSMQRLDAAGARIFINTMAVRTNLGQMDALYDWMTAHPSVKGWRIGLPKVLGRYEQFHEQLEVSFEEVIQVFVRILHRWLSERPSFRLELSDFFRTDSLETGLEDHGIDDNPCKYALTNLTIKPDGKAVFCASLEIHEPAVLGNVVDEGLAAVWYGERHKRFRSARIRDLAECSACRYVRLCGGGCRSNALLSYGDIRARDPRACVAMDLLEREMIHVLPVSFRDEVAKLIQQETVFVPAQTHRRFI